MSDGSGKPAVKFDKVVEVLKKLQGKQKVNSEEAEQAIRQHNQRMEEIQRLRQNQNAQEDSVGSSKAMDKLRNENKELNERIVKLNDQIRELQLRLSKVAGDKLTDDNPGLADLSDPYRPTKLAEKFRQVYDDEWSHAYEEMDKLFNNAESDKTIVLNLTVVIKNIEEFCKSVEKSQLRRVADYLADDLTSTKYEYENGTMGARNKSVMDANQEKLFEKMLRDLRKSLGSLCVTPLTEIFGEHILKPLKRELRMSGKAEMTGLNEFVSKCLELIWLMKLQCPPMEFLWAKEGEYVDKNRFTFYTKTGEIVKHNVWPAVLLHKDGPLVSKGIVQGQ